MQDYPNELGHIEILDERDVYGPKGKVTHYLVACWVEQKHMEQMTNLTSQ
jgi:hypothetical protein